MKAVIKFKKKTYILVNENGVTTCETGGERKQNHQTEDEFKQFVSNLADFGYEVTEKDF